MGFHEDDCGAGKPIKNNTPGAAVKILGSGCDRCQALGEAALEALRELNMTAEVEYVTDIFKISEYDVMNAPALVIDGKVVSIGMVLDKDEVLQVLKFVRG